MSSPREHSPTRVSIIDSHTGGEPTRVVHGGGPALQSFSLADQLREFAAGHDRFRRAVVNEPRGSDVMVGALLVKPEDRTCAAGVLFFNNVGPLGMCGHGMIGVVVTLAHLGIIAPGEHRIETPVGQVTAWLGEDGKVAIANVVSWREAKSVTFKVPGYGEVTGDVAWGGNWFLLIDFRDIELALENLELLTGFAWTARRAANAQGFPAIDHVELFGPAQEPGGDARSFVLCPGRAYDRSPCGTGTSAKLACLAADGKLAEGEDWVQESIIGSRFVGRYRWVDREAGRIEPTVIGTAHIMAEGTLILDGRDPFQWGIPSAAGAGPKPA